MLRLLLALCLALPVAAQYVNATAGGNDSVAFVDATAASHTTGNLLWVVAKTRDACGATTMAITDTAGNTYTQIGALVDNAGLTCTGHFYAKNITGHASNVVRLTLEGTHRFPSLKVVQLSGRDTVNPLTTSAVGTTTSLFTVTSGSFTTTVADTVVVAGLAAYASDGPTAGNIGGGAATLSTGSDGYSQTVWAEYRELSSTQAGITADIVSTGTISTIVVAAFAASGGAPTPAARRRVIN